MAEIISLRREELYELVWKKPMIKLAKEFGLSNQGLAKICKRHEIPRPGLGYWAKVEHGKAPPRTSLPHINSPALCTISFGKPRIPVTLQPITPDLDKGYSNVKTAALAFKIPDKIHSYPEVIAAYRRSVKNNHTNRYGFLVIRNRDLKDIEIKLTPSTYNRGCHFLNALSLLFNKLGWELKQGDNNGYLDRALIVSNGEDDLRIKLKEKIRQIDYQPTSAEVTDTKKWNYRSYNKYSYVALGVLELYIEGIGSYSGLRKKWVDRNNKPLENIFEQIATGFARAFDYQKMERLKRKQQAEEWRKEQALKAEMIRQQNVENERQNYLFDLLNKHSAAQQLRDMIYTIEKHLTDTPGGNEWIAWATQLAYNIDPTHNPDSIVRHHMALDQDL